MKPYILVTTVSALTVVILFSIFRQSSYSLRATVKAVNCGSMIDSVKTDQGTLRLPMKGWEDGPMPVLFKDGTRDLWNTSTFCGNEEFRRGIIGKPFLIEYNAFRTVKTWKEM